MRSTRPFTCPARFMCWGSSRDAFPRVWTFRCLTRAICLSLKMRNLSGWWSSFEPCCARVISQGACRERAARHRHLRGDLVIADTCFYLERGDEALAPGGDPPLGDCCLVGGRGADIFHIVLYYSCSNQNHASAGRAMGSADARNGGHGR